MRRLSTVGALCAAILCLAAPAVGAAPPAHLGDGHHEARAGDPPSLSASDDLGKAHHTPLGARLAAATATVDGHLYRSDGSPTAGATIEWDSYIDPYVYWGTSTTDSSGYFSDAVVPSDNGELWAYPDESTAFAFSDSWSDGGSYSRLLYPGRVYAGATLGGSWAGAFDYLAVRVWNSARSQFSRGEIPANGTDTPAALIDVLQGTYDRGSAKFFYDEGVEFSGSIVVPSGAQSSAGVSVNEADAQRIWLTSPYWASGKPGTTVRLVRDNYPEGWVNAVTGYSDNPALNTTWTYDDKTSSGASRQSLSVKVPSKATPGYQYWIGLEHKNGLGTLYLETPFQVCTMRASKTSIRKGAKIRVKGVIPTAGHWGDQTGLKKTVTLYAHKGTAGVPTKWNPKSKGWVKVVSVRANGKGAYTTPYFKPLKTLALVVRYPGDDWYFRGYTSTQKIRVR